jgi:hypothetical protein
MGFLIYLGSVLQFAAINQIWLVKLFDTLGPLARSVKMFHSVVLARSINLAHIRLLSSLS